MYFYILCTYCAVYGDTLSSDIGVIYYYTISYAVGYILGISCVAYGKVCKIEYDCMVGVFGIFCFLFEKLYLVVLVGVVEPFEQIVEEEVRRQAVS